MPPEQIKKKTSIQDSSASCSRNFSAARSLSSSSLSSLYSAPRPSATTNRHCEPDHGARPRNSLLLGRS
jgi:hypothetical protein